MGYRNTGNYGGLLAVVHRFKTVIIPLFSGDVRTGIKI